MSKLSHVPLSFSPPQSWRKARRMTGVVLALIALAPVFVVTRVLTLPGEAAKLHGLPLQVTLLVTVILMPVLATWLVALCFFGAERLRFEIADGALVVHTLLRTYKLPLLGVKVQRTSAKLSMRLAGTGLPGFYTGYYLLGDQRARVWATMREGGVVLDGAARWFITPADIDGFLEAAKAAGAHVQ